jgi:hypothetical protein
VFVHTDSDHEFKTLVLLAVDTTDGPLYFVIEGQAVYEGKDTPDDSYYYEEHSCPTNYVRVAMISLNGDHDPHGVFRYVRSVWMPKEYDEDDGGNLILSVFPELAGTPALPSSV